ncbi:hypothetical protein [Mesorhizobium sp. BE184]|uniref:hypothetical protein n=1 Tax=Mesorhizobium sp. BE184 TaxID=2817714 RepID=UPI00285752C7|nr:hypothetical protein [Mesorhizobium sp. BE184]MDR7035235.1 hypothetical protein [Mesorhizobium sp. BE184]
MSWQENFQNYTTSVAFSVQLSNVQVRALDAISSNTWLGNFHMFFSTAGALQRRGLVEFNARYSPERPWRYRLTPAGELVLSLVQMSGALGEEVDPKFEVA